MKHATKQFQRGYTLAELLVVLLAFAVVGLVYVLVHFVSKFW